MSSSDFYHLKSFLSKSKNIKDLELDKHYAWHLNYLIETEGQTKSFRCEDQTEYEYENEKEIENEDEDEDEDDDEDDVEDECEDVDVDEDEDEDDSEDEDEDECEDEDEDEDEEECEDEDVDENNKDPQYCMFLENLTIHDKAYKLKISQSDEEPSFLYYEDPDDPDWFDENIHELFEDPKVDQKANRRPNEKKGAVSTKKKVSKRKKINNPKSTTQPPHQKMTMDNCYMAYLNTHASSKLVAVKSEEKSVEYEKNVASESDPDVICLNKVQNGSEVNSKQLVLAENEPALREKLLHILRQPYNEEEFEKLSKDLEQKKPICRSIELRHRSISSAYSGVERSLLDLGPGSFRSELETARDDPLKALNLLRMFRFWVEHAPNEQSFQPWRDKHLLIGLSSETATLELESDEMLLLDK